MSIHFGKLVDSIRDRQGMTKSEFGRRLQYHVNSIPLMMKRAEWNTDLIDRSCEVLKYNFYLDKAKEVAALLDPSGVSEPVVPYETENFKAKYMDCKRELAPLNDKVKLLESLVESQKNMIEMLRNKQIKNGHQA